MEFMEVTLQQTVAILFLMTAFLLAVRYYLRCHTVQIYNWDGKRYRFLGRERLRKINDTYVITMRERIGDMSYTTRYRLSASPEFVRRNRYGSLRLCAGQSEAWLPIEEQMQEDIYFRI